MQMLNGQPVEREADAVPKAPAEFRHDPYAQPSEDWSTPLTPLVAPDTAPVMGHRWEAADQGSGLGRASAEGSQRGRAPLAPLQPLASIALGSNPSSWGAFDDCKDRLRGDRKGAAQPEERQLALYQRPLLGSVPAPPPPPPTPSAPMDSALSAGAHGGSGSGCDYFSDSGSWQRQNSCFSACSGPDHQDGYLSSVLSEQQQRQSALQRIIYLERVTNPSTNQTYTVLTTQQRNEVPHPSTLYSGVHDQDWDVPPPPPATPEQGHSLRTSVYDNYPSARGDSRQALVEQILCRSREHQPESPSNSVTPWRRTLGSQPPTLVNCSGMASDRKHHSSDSEGLTLSMNDTPNPPTLDSSDQFASVERAAARLQHQPEPTPPPQFQWDELRDERRSTQGLSIRCDSRADDERDLVQELYKAVGGGGPEGAVQRGGGGGRRGRGERRERDDRDDELRRSDDVPPYWSVTVQFKHGRLQEFAHQDYQTLYPGDHVIVEGDRGFDLGMAVVCKEVTTLSAFDIVRNRRKVVRMADDDEIDHWRNTLVHDEVAALEFMQQQVDLHQVPIRLHRAEFQFDRKKLTFHYSSASAHPDFRQLLRDGYRQFRCRIWMNNCMPKGADPGESIDISTNSGYKCASDSWGEREKEREVDQGEGSGDAGTPPRNRPRRGGRGIRRRGGGRH